MASEEAVHTGGLEAEPAAYARHRNCWERGSPGSNGSSEADRSPRFTTFVSSFKHLFYPQSPTFPRNYQAALKGLARVSAAQLEVKEKQ